MVAKKTWTLQFSIKRLFPGLFDHVVNYPTPSALSYLWGLGGLAGILLGLQILTGIMLAMHYIPNVDYAFFSVEHIMRDVNHGWFLRYLHSNGASMFFAIVYLHMGRGLYYGSYLYPRETVWISGVLIFLLMMATAFIGYVLPWGQMSFWGATVITNLFSVIPFIGDTLVYWIWGGFSVNNSTLNRFFSLHYLLPFILVFLVLLHIYLIHKKGSSTPLGIDVRGSSSKLNFYPYFYVKDLLGFLVFLLIYSIFVFYLHNVLGHSDNYILANPLSTPAHIVPEWYFLPFYAILRSIPDKTFGVLCMGSALVVLLVLPYLHDTKQCRSLMFKPIDRILFWYFVMVVILLGWVGQKPIQYPYKNLGVLLAHLYFLYFLF